MGKSNSLPKAADRQGFDCPADFNNESGPVFDDTLRTALTVAINQSPRGRVAGWQGERHAEVDGLAFDHQADSRGDARSIHPGSREAYVDGTISALGTVEYGQFSV